MSAGYSTTLLCTQCHQPFSRKPSHARKLKLGFCSRPCKKAYLQDVPARFWEKVLKKGPKDCWIWQGGTSSGGYGSVGLTSHGKFRVIAAHRIAYELQHGLILPHMHVLHRCDTPLCMNGNHLFLGTNADNAYDRHAKGRDSHVSVNRGESHGLAKLSDADCVNIRVLRQQGVPRYEVARMYKVHPTHISYICSGRSRKHA